MAATIAATAASPPPPLLLARATDTAVIDDGHFTFRTLEYALVVNTAIAAFCFAAFTVARTASPLAAKLYTPRQMLAVAESESDAADADAAGAAVDAEQARRAALASLVHDHARARRLPPLPARGWITFLFSIPDEHVIDYAGLDALIFMRFYALCATLFVPAALAAPLLLCPLFMERAPVADGSALSPTASAERYSIASLNDGSPRFWAPVAAAYALTLSLGFLLAREQRALLRLRLAAAAAAPPRPDELAVLVTDIPPSHASARDVADYFRRMYPGLGPYPLVAMAPISTEQVETCWQARNAAASTAHAARAAAAQAEAAAAAREALGGDCSAEEDALWVAAAVASKASDALREAESALRRARADALRGPSAAAFVLFPTRAAAAAAAGTLHSAAGGAWHAQPAPPPAGVLWPALQLPPLARASRRAAATAAGAALVLSFLFVIAGVATLVSASSTSWLPHRLAGAGPLLGGYGAVLALLVGLYGAPIAFQALAAGGGHVSRADADADASAAFFWLCVLDVFAGSAALQAVATQLGLSLRRGADGFSLADVGDAVGGSVPGAAPFFIAFALTRAGTALAAQLTRATDAPALLSRLASARTARAERQAWAPQPPPFVDWGPSALFLLLLGLVYTPLAPLIAPPVAAAFSGGAVVFRYQLLYVYAPARAGGGRLWLHLRDGAAHAALVTVAVLAAVLAWRRAAAEALMLAPLFTLTFVSWRALAADDGGEAFARLPRDVAAAADAAFGPLPPPPLPFPFPEAFYPHCMFDDTALEADEPRSDAHRAADVASAAQVRRSQRGQQELQGARQLERGERQPLAPLAADSGGSGWSMSEQPRRAGGAYGAMARAPPPPESSVAASSGAGDSEASEEPEDTRRNLNKALARTRRWGR